MPKHTGQKLKILYILKYLTEHTDENHPATTNELIAHLAANDIHAERKSIYTDIQELIQFGYDIVQVSSRAGGGYYLASREFELAELKLLVDAVQSSRFITTNKSRGLIEKISCLASKHDAGKLRRQVYVAGRIKTENEGIYYSIDCLHEAIQENKKVSFLYYEWDVNKKLQPRTESKRVVSPWALVWRDENYYLIAFDGEDGILKHYRVDKMGKTTLVNRPRQGAEVFENLNLTEYYNRTFGMYAGDEEVVTMEFPAHLVGVVIDRFGKDASIRVVPGNRIRLRAKVSVSGQFFGWLCGIGKDACIVEPTDVKEQYLNWIKQIISVG